MNEEILKILDSIDWTKSEECPCPKCACPVFKAGYVIRKVAAADSPNGNELILPMRIFACDNCGNVDESMQVMNPKPQDAGGV